VLVQNAEEDKDEMELADGVTGHVNGVPQLINVVVVKTVTVTRGRSEHVGTDIPELVGAI
jgi:hypothetical protein